MTVLLVGGTGLLGGAVASELARRGHALRALVRSEHKASGLQALGAELTPGDLRDPESLRRAVRGVRAVVCTAQGDPMNPRKRLADIDGRGVQALIGAAATAGVEQFVFVSALKAAEAAATVPQLRYKRAAEQTLIGSGMRYTILQPSSFQETFGDAFAPFKRILQLTGLGLTLGPGSGEHSFVAVEDVARAAAIALERPEATNATLPIGGTDDLSYREAYRHIGALTHRRVLVVGIPHPLLALVGRLAAPTLPDLAGFFAYFAFFDRAGYTCATPVWLVEALGHRRTFDEAVRAMYGVGSQ